MYLVHVLLKFSLINISFTVYGDSQVKSTTVSFAKRYILIYYLYVCTGTCTCTYVFKKAMHTVYIKKKKDFYFYAYILYLHVLHMCTRRYMYTVPVGVFF